MRDDFTTYTEVDANTRIIPVASQVSWAALVGNEISYVYFDFGANYFSSSFSHSFMFSFTPAGGNGFCMPWSLTNGVGARNTHETSTNKLLGVYLYGTAIYLREYESGLYWTATGITISSGVEYKAKVVRDEAVGTYGTLYLYVYSDYWTTQITGSPIYLTLHSNIDFRYLYSCMSFGSASITGSSSGYCKEMRPRPLVAPLHKRPVVANLRRGT